MTTIIYQKYISKYLETFTLVEVQEGDEYYQAHIVPATRVAKMDEEEYEALLNILRASENEKASWSDGEEEFDEADVRAAYHQKWDRINSDLDKMGI